MKHKLEVFISLAMLLFISACGSGGKFTTPLLNQTVSGQMYAPSGHIAYFQEKSLNETVDLIFPGAVADRQDGDKISDYADITNKSDLRNADTGGGISDADEMDGSRTPCIADRPTYLGRRIRLHG